MNKKKALAVILLVTIALLVYLLFPLADSSLAITFDREKIRKKDEFLAGVPRVSAHGTVPNVIIIMADDLGKSEVSLYNDSPVDTPHIDSIGQEGVTFTEGYCTAPICSPSRAGLLTGRYQQRFGFEVQPMTRYPRNRLEHLVYKNFIDTGDMVMDPVKPVPTQEAMDLQGLPPSEINLAELLHARGYDTGMVGKWHLGYTSMFYPHNRGFDYHYGFLEAFTLYAPEGSPGIAEYHHDIFSIKHQWNRGRNGASAIRINGKEINEKEYLTFAIARKARKYIRQHRDRPFLLYVPFNAPHIPFQAPEKYYKRFAHVKDKAKRVYYAMIAALDDAVGSILETVKKEGLEENTIIFFASDNGGAVYTGATTNAPLRGGKFTQFNGGLEIPFMMKWKGRIKSNTRYDKPVMLPDIFMTAAVNTDTPVPSYQQYDGKDLVPHVTGKAVKAPHDMLCWRAMYNKAIRKGEWKLLVSERSGQKELFHISEDRGEQRVVSKAYPQVVTELLQDLENWEKGLQEPRWPHFMNFHHRDKYGSWYFAM